MRVLFWLYVAAYVALSIGGLYDSFFLSGREAWALMLELASAIFGCAGMLLYFLRARVSREVSNIWKFVFPLLVVEVIVSSWLDLAHVARDPELGPLFAVAIGLIVTAFLFPSFWMNWKVATGQSRSVA